MLTQVTLIYKLLQFTVTHFDLSLQPAWKISRSLDHLWSSGSLSAALPVCLVSYIEEDGTISVALMLQGFLSGPRECYCGETNKHLPRVFFKSVKC